MTDLANLSDRDLIVLMHGKMDTLTAMVTDHENRLRTLESKQTTQEGFWAGANWLRGVLLGVVTGAGGWFIGQR